MFNVTILGCNGPYPSAGGACSSYLLNAGDSKILIDAGSGSLSNLMKVMEPDKLDCIILSHLHWDHMTDIPVLYYNLLIKNKGGLFNGKIDVYMPGSPRGIASIIEGFEFFNVHILSEETRFNVNGCNFSFKRMTHPVECYAVKAEFSDRKFVYSGDTTLNGELPVFAYGCNLLLADAAFLDNQLKADSPHMSSAQCASIAKIARAEVLALTHQNPYTKINDYENEAREIFQNSQAVKIMEKMEI